MNEELKALIAQEKNDIIEQESSLPAQVADAVKNKPVDEIIDSAFNQAIVTKINESEELKEELMSSAERVIKNKTDAINSKTDQESKEAHFNNKKGACECFGYNEATTEKWAVNAMNIWHNIMTAIWIAIGAFTFAPVTFVSKKLIVIFKKAWIAVLLAIIIYLAVVFVPVIITLLT